MISQFLKLNSQMIRALHDKTRRLRLDDFFSHASLDRRAEEGTESFLDTFGTMIASRHQVIGEAEDRKSVV